MEAALVGASAVVEGVGVAPGPLEARLEALAEEHPIERRPVPLRVEQVAARQCGAVTVQAPASVRGHLVALLAPCILSMHLVALAHMLRTPVATLPLGVPRAIFRQGRRRHRGLVWLLEGWGGGLGGGRLGGGGLGGGGLGNLIVMVRFAHPLPLLPGQ